jgi:hypothetical protein
MYIILIYISPTTKKEKIHIRIFEMNPIMRGD